jgi:hypothetical protein
MPDGRSSVRVLAVSDEVDQGLLAGAASVRTADLILACGDLPLDYLSSLINALATPLTFVPGNHDPDLSGCRLSRSGMLLRAGLPDHPPWPAGAFSVDGQILDVAGLRVAGQGGCLRYRNGPNQYTERQQAGRARALRRRARPRALQDGRGIDVLITQAPPRGVGDGEDPAHRGFAWYHDLVAAIRPRALLRGHVEPQPGGPARRQVGRTAVRNVTGWRLREIGPDGVTSLIPGRRRAI